MFRIPCCAFSVLLAITSSAVAGDVKLTAAQGRDGSKSQQWQMKSIGNNQYNLVNVGVTQGTGGPNVLDYKEGAVAYLEEQRGPEGNEAQRWLVEPIGDDLYLIKNVRRTREVGISMVLDYKNADTLYLEQQRDKNGNEAQRWRRRTAGNGVYVFENIRLSREKKTPLVLTAK